ncbi:hypothetical protein [Bradyrhizobium sp. 27S5]
MPSKAKISNGLGEKSNASGIGSQHGIDQFVNAKGEVKAACDL